jgi:hypothetical protein
MFPEVASGAKTGTRTPLAGAGGMRRIGQDEAPRISVIGAPALGCPPRNRGAAGQRPHLQLCGRGTTA